MSSQNVWEFVTSNCDIVSVISQYIDLTKNGRNYKACCPFHDEKTPSFIISNEKGIFKCFGCGKSGNVIKFIELKENLNSIQALKFLANKYNLDISSFGNFLNEANVSTEASKIFEINNVAHDFFRYQITFEKTNELEAFLQKRKLTKEIIKEFEIGFAPKDKLIYEKFKENNLDDFAIFNSSLLSNKNNNNFFNDRLMFPVFDKFGNIVAFSGRDITNNQVAKYINSSETIVFKKSEVMFNYFHAKEEINKKNEVYLVEGQFDCIALYKSGIKNAVAIMGTSLSAIHLKELSNKDIILFFDNDKAGKNATLKNLKMILYYLRKFNLSVSFVKNDLNKDPDELYNLDDGISLSKIANNKIGLVEFLFDILSEISKSDGNEEEKFNSYKQTFEFIYYLSKQLSIILQERLAKEGILSEKLFNSYFKDYSKPNFPSDSNFKQVINANHNHGSIERNFNSNNEYSNYFLGNLDPYTTKDKEIQIKPKKMVNPDLIQLSNILFIILTYPDYINCIPLDKFETINVYENIKAIKDLIIYVIKKHAQGIILNKDNLYKTLKDEQERETNNKIKKEYASYLIESKIIEDYLLENKDIEKFNVFYQKVNEWIKQKNKKSKQIIKSRGTNGQ